MLGAIEQEKHIETVCAHIVFVILKKKGEKTKILSLLSMEFKRWKNAESNLVRRLIVYHRTNL